MELLRLLFVMLMKYRERHGRWDSKGPLETANGEHNWDVNFAINTKIIGAYSNVLITVVQDIPAVNCRDVSEA